MPDGRNGAAPGSFRWPSRELADASERAADRAAELGLERLRARARRLRTRPPSIPAPRPTVIDVEPAPAPPPAPEPVDSPVVEQTPAPEPEREPTPAPWDEELDALTEELVAELRRDLGPAAT